MFEYKAAHTILTVAVHPLEACIATGHSGGQIILWFVCLSGVDSHGCHSVFLAHYDVTSTFPDLRYYADLQGNYLAAPRTVPMHWHAYEVTALLFHPDGNYLVSGTLTVHIKCFHHFTSR